MRQRGFFFLAVGLILAPLCLLRLLGYSGVPASSWKPWDIYYDFHRSYLLLEEWNRPAPELRVQARYTDSVRTRAEKYQDLIARKAARYDLDPDLLQAMIFIESHFAYRARSSKGATGLMQIIPSTAKELGVVDLQNPEQNVEGGAKYLRQLLDRFQGRTTLALAGYNAGPGAVVRFGGVPPYRETIRYVRDVQAAAAFFRAQRPSQLPIEVLMMLFLASLAAATGWRILRDRQQLAAVPIVSEAKSS